MRGVVFRSRFIVESQKAGQTVFSHLTGQLHLLQTKVSLLPEDTTPLLLSPFIDPYDHYILFFDLSITYT